MRLTLFFTPAICFIVGLVCAVNLYQMVENSQSLEKQQRFYQQANSYVKTIQSGLRNNRELLVSLKSFIANSDTLSREKFDQFAQDLLKERHYIQALEWIPRVSYQQRSAYEEAARTQGLIDFSIKYKRAGKMQKSPFQFEYYPVYYLYPEKGNEAAIGFDLSSNSARLQALEQARDSNTAVMSHGIKLVQELHQQSGVLLFLPVYEGNEAPLDIGQRIRELKGFALLVLRVPDLIRQVSADLPVALNLEISDVEDGQLLYKKGAGQFVRDDKHYFTTINFAHRSWEIRLRAIDQANVEGQLFSKLAALGVLLITLLVCLHLFNLNRTNHRIKREVERQTQALQTSQDRFSLAAQGASVGIWDWGEGSKTQYWSPQLYSLIGYEDREIVANIENFFKILHPQDRKSVRDCLVKHIKARIPFEIEYRIRHKCGDYQWFLASGQAAWNSEGKAFRMAGSIQNIDDRKKAELAIQHYAEDLRRSNQDLEQFAYVASHDLKAPLRGIGTLALWIEESVDEHLDDETRSYMNLLKGRVARLEKLLAGLLQYSRAGTEKGILVAVDVCKIVAQIEDLLCAKDAGFEIECNVGVIHADTLMINQILQNLINNSMKHHHQKSGRIQIASKMSGNKIIISVADDGPGIEAAMDQKIFEMFQTLKPRDEVEGSGMGLAIVKKLIERSGGNVWIEHQGHLGGCCICFSLPLLAEQHT